MSEMSNTPEQLAARLDRALPPGTAFTPPRTKDPLVNTAIEIAATPFPALSEAASKRIEARMLAAFDQQYPAQNGKARSNGAHPATDQPSIALVPKTRRSPVPVVLRWAAAAVLIFVILSGGMTAASASAVPGDALYPVKRAVEQVELVVARSSAERAEVLLKQARRRAEEALVLTVRREETNTVLIEARQNIIEAEQLAPELMAQPEFAQSISAINVVIEAISGSDEPPAQAPEDEQPQGLPLLNGSDTPSPTPSATPSLTVTPSPTRTPRTRVPFADETGEAADATRTPRSTNTPRPTHTPRAETTPATARPTHVPPTQAQGGQQATNCPGNSCNAQATNPPQGTPAGGQGNGNDPPADPGGGNGNNNGNGNASNPPGDNPGVSDSPGNSENAGAENSNAGGNGNNGNNGNGNNGNGNGG